MCIRDRGHAVYTKSDPRAVILRKRAKHLALEKGFEKEYNLLCAVERLGPVAMARFKKAKDVCANVDLYSGFIYRMPVSYTHLQDRASAS